MNVRLAQRSDIIKGIQKAARVEREAEAATTVGILEVLVEPHLIHPRSKLLILRVHLIRGLVRAHPGATGSRIQRYRKRLARFRT